MIDTIKGYVEFEEEEIKQIVNCSTEIRKIDHVSHEIIFKKYEGKIPVGSHDSAIRYSMFEGGDNIFRFELSLPKLLYGHNVYLLSPEYIPLSIAYLHQCFCSRFGVFPHPSRWRLTRIDLCYSWKLPSQEIADRFLNVIRSFDYPRKDKLNYDTSVMLKGSTYSMKFYLKKPEYLDHDYKILKKFDKQLAQNVLHLSDGILRFEVSLRIKSFKTYFKRKEVYAIDLYSLNYIELLKIFYKKYVKGAYPKYQTTADVLSKLAFKYKKAKCFRLFQFYQTFIAPNGEALCKEHLSRNTISLNKRDLIKAGISLTKKSETKLPKLKLKLPSKHQMIS